MKRVGELYDNLSIPEKEKKKKQQNTTETKTSYNKKHLNMHIIKKKTGSAF